MDVLGLYIRSLGKKAEEHIEKGVEKFLPCGQDLVYLDCGCADGIKTALRASKIGTKHVLGIEYNTKNKRLRKGIKVYRTDLNKKWPIGSGTVDCVTATEVVEHLYNLDNFFQEAKRVLKKRGRIIISTENLAAYHNIFSLFLGNQPYTGPYLSSLFPVGHRPNADYWRKDSNMAPHLNVMTVKALCQLLLGHGFKPRAIVGVGFYPLPEPIASIFAAIDKYHASYCVAFAER